MIYFEDFLYLYAALILTRCCFARVRGPMLTQTITILLMLTGLFSWLAYHSNWTKLKAGKYVYQPLPSGPYIRVLHLQTGKESEPVRCSTEIVSLKNWESINYKTISYEWGPANEMRTIVMDGYEVAVRQNLHSYLKALRNIYQFVTIWADALCIDQSSATEKNHQVQQMWEVYSKAHGTHVFLNAGLSSSQLDEWTGPNSLTLETQKKILDSTYWTRLWIVQEIIASRFIMIHVSGDNFWSWESFKNRCSTGKFRLGLSFSTEDYPFQRRDDLARNVARSSFRTLDDYREQRLSMMTSSQQYQPNIVGRDRLDWLELLASYGEHMCTDVRGRIYSLNNFSKSPVVVDYSITSAQLLCNVVKACPGGLDDPVMTVNKLARILAVDQPFEGLELFQKPIMPVLFRNVGSRSVDQQTSDFACSWGWVAHRMSFEATRLYTVRAWPERGKRDVVPKRPGLIESGTPLIHSICIRLKVERPEYEDEQVLEQVLSLYEDLLQGQVIHCGKDASGNEAIETLVVSMSLATYLSLMQIVGKNWVVIKPLSATCGTIRADKVQDTSNLQIRPASVDLNLGEQLGSVQFVEVYECIPTLPEGILTNI